MVNLYIDNYPIVLDEGFSFPLLEENPVYTKNSQYTYDVTISLLIAQNAKVYQYINRGNINNKIPTKRRAILIVNGKVCLNGTEVILEFTESNVKIQLLSGNSELNFVAGGNRKLRDLKEMGSATPFTSDKIEPGDRRMDISRQVFQSLHYSYPARDWHLLPYYTGEDMWGNIDHSFGYAHGNYYFLYPGWYPDEIQPDASYDAEYVESYSGQVPQPYLCFIIERVLKALGYTLVNNAIAKHPVLKDMYIVHGIRTYEYAKMLPDWTVDEFLSKIEFQFDCVFVVDASTRNVDLLFNYDTQVSPNTVSLKTIDELMVTQDDENRVNIRISNIAYNLDSEDYYLFMDVDPAFIAKVEADGMMVNYNFLPEMIAMVENDTDINRFKKIWTDGYDMFIAFDTGRVINGKPEVRPRRIHSFKPLMKNPESTEIDQDFDIIPASMVIQCIGTTQDWDPAWMQIATAGTFDPLSIDASTGDQTDFNLQSLIEGETSLNKELSYSKMRVAIYSGISELDTKNVRSRYPISYVESLAEYFEASKIVRYFGPIGGDPFRLKNLYNDIYRKATIIDTTKTYKYLFELENEIDIRSDFIINNKRFVCFKIEREITPLGFAPLAIGYFYPYTKEMEA